LADLSQSKSDTIETRQVHDIPLIKIQVTEYQAEKKQCSCGHVTCGTFPPEVKAGVQYGARIKGLALYLHSEQKLPYARCCAILTDYFGSSFSEGSLFTTQEKAHEVLLPIEEKTKAALIGKKVLHHDETGMQINKKLHWLHVAGNDKLTAFQIHAKRGKKAMDEHGLLPKFNGILVHDHWKTYFLYTQMQHSLCNAHHLRELKSFEEEGQIWAGKMRMHLKEWCHIVNEAQRENKNKLPETVYQENLKKYQTILGEGEKELPIATKEPNKRGRPKQPRGRNLLHRLRDYQEEVLHFSRDFDVPFTNNQAERDIRMAKLKQKISGGFRSLNGAKMFARLSGYLSTLRKQKINIADAMTSLARGNPILPNF
jgi:transposase